jgi:DNA-directed RNA polymerase specialized sigma subunit
MNVKEYLSRYHNTELKIMRLQVEVEEYIRLANSIPGINFDQIRVDGTKSLEAPFEKWIRRALDNEHLIVDLKRKLPIFKGEIISVIDELKDTELRKVLLYRYIDWLSWNDIAVKMFVSISTLKRWHLKAIEELDNQPKDNKFQ